MQAERVEQWRSGEVRFPSARINPDTIIDFFGTDQEPIGKEGVKNQDQSPGPLTDCISHGVLVKNWLFGAILTDPGAG